MSASKLLVVTGGSRGIGAAVARLAAGRGFDVALSYVARQDAAEALASSIRGTGRVARAFRADVSDSRQVTELFQRIDGELGRPIALVTCAGITGGVRSIVDTTASQFEQVVAANLLGTFYCVREAALRMATSRGGAGGAIVTVSSEAARFGGNRLAAYAAAKAGVSTFTIAAGRELAEEGIRVNAVSPGLIDTEQHAGQSAERIAGLIDGVPLKRLGRAEEVAEAVMWLLSEKSSYITGSLVSVNGGR